MLKGMPSSDSLQTSGLGNRLLRLLKRNKKRFIRIGVPLDNEHPPRQGRNGLMWEVLPCYELLLNHLERLME